MTDQNHPEKEEPARRPGRTPLQTFVLARRHLARTALAVSILAPAVIAAAVFGVREEMFDWRLGLETMIEGWAPNLAMLGGVLAAVAVLLAFAVPPRRERTTALGALAVAAVTLAGLNQVQASRAGAPPIHDVATDWDDPLLFGPATMAARGPEANPVLPDPRVPALRNERLAEVNMRACPGAVPVILPLAPEAAYQRARAALEAQGLTVVSDNPAAGRMEAEATSRWFRFRSDVIVRIRPEGAGTRIDIRSVSREVEADGGANCRRVTALRQALAG